MVFLRYLGFIGTLVLVCSVCSVSVAGGKRTKSAEKAKSHVTKPKKVQPGALLRAAEQQDWSKVKELVSNGADINEMDRDGTSTLMHASWSGQKEIVRLLLRYKAKINLKGSEDGNTALHLASLQGHEEIVQLLISHGADLNKQNFAGQAPLRLAAWAGHMGVVRTLLLNNANVNIEDQQKMTPLHLASDQNHLAIVKMLLAKGAKVDAIDNDGQTPLMTAAYQGHAGCVRALLKAKANTTLRMGPRQFTALMLAAQEGHLGVIREYRANNADMNQTDSGGYTALMIASKIGYLDVVNEVIAQGAELDHASENGGFTALSVASLRGHLPVVKFLVRAGAAINHTNDRINPIVAAIGSNHTQIAEFLLAHLKLDSDAMREMVALADTNLWLSIVINTIEKRRFKRLLKPAIRQASHETAMCISDTVRHTPTSFPLPPELEQIIHQILFYKSPVLAVD